MPIKPEKKDLYPDNWEELARTLKEAAGRCEECGVEHNAVGARDREDQWHNERDIHLMNSDCGYALFGEFPRVIRIILTVAHLDHNPANNDPANLRVLCQRCHLNYDRPHHLANAWVTRAHNRGQMILFNTKQYFTKETSQ